MHIVDNDNFWYNVNPYAGSDMEKLFNSSEPSDYVVLDDSMIDKLCTLAKDLGFGKFETPSDIVKGGTIPIPDILFKINNTVEEAPNVDQYARFKFYNGELYYKDVVHSNNTNYTMIDSYIVGYSDKAEKELLIDAETVWLNDIAVKVYDQEITQSSLDDFRNWACDMYEERDTILALWYVIQILLLNPDIVKSNLLKPSGKEKIPNYIMPNKKASRKRKAKYMKRLMLNSDYLCSKKEFERHTLCWYVIGHYRKHGDGKVWVNGYWKGPLRHAKTNSDNGRERVIL